MRNAKSRTDGNQTEIVAALRKAGATVKDLHELRHGVPDIMVKFRGQSWFMEIKMPGEKLTAAEREWFEYWPDISHIVYGPEQALGIIYSATEAQP